MCAVNVAGNKKVRKFSLGFMAAYVKLAIKGDAAKVLEMAKQ